MQRSVHLVGIAGTGMSALAEALLDAGRAVTGSDRFFDRGAAVPALDALRARGVPLFPQDGSGVGPATECVVVSTAVEADNPDLAAAARLGVPVRHRAAALAALLSDRRLVAVAGTSGKSTTTALLGHLLAEAGLDPTVVDGAACLNWRAPDRTGAVRAGAPGGLCVAEVDESDRSLLSFRPAAALLLNASADHFPLGETNDLFDRFLAQVEPGGPVVDARGEPPVACEEGPWSVSFHFRGRRMEVPLPGAHHAQDAALACRMALALGAPEEALAPALSSFRGLARRMELVGVRADGLRVVDDYAHNTEKLRATLSALEARAPRVFAIWRPHGYAPLRKMRDDLAAMFRDTLRPDDRLLLLPVFDAGGTAARDVSSDDFASQLRALGVPAECVPDAAAAAAAVSAAAGPADIAATLGARDPDLPRLARAIAGLRDPVAAGGLPA